MKAETPFKGSVLETEIRNIREPNKLAKFHQLAKGAKEEKPTSQFWSEAFEQAMTQLEQLQKNKFKTFLQII